MNVQLDQPTALANAQMPEETRRAFDSVVALMQQGMTAHLFAFLPIIGLNR